MADKTKLEIRTAIKKRKPTYRRRQSNQFAKLAKNDVWRRPKGMGNKSRRNRRGHIGMLKVGYGSPKSVRGTNRDGLFEVVIGNIEQLKLVDSKTQIGVISRTVGAKKKLAILEYALKEKLSIGNVGNISQKIEDIKARKELSDDTKKAVKSLTSKKEISKLASNNAEKNSDNDVRKKPNKEIEKKEDAKVQTSSETPVTKKVTTTTTTTTTKTASVKTTAKSTSSSSEKKEVTKK